MLAILSLLRGTRRIPRPRIAAPPTAQAPGRRREGRPVDAVEAAWFELFEEPMVLGSFAAFMEFGRLGELVGRTPRDDVCLHTLRDDERVSTPPLGPSNVRPTPPPGSAKRSRDFAGRRARATPPRA